MRQAACAHTPQRLRCTAAHSKTWHHPSHVPAAPSLREDIGTVEAFYNANLALTDPAKAQFRCGAQQAAPKSKLSADKALL